MLLYLDKTDSLSSTRRKKVTHTVIHLSTSECYTGTWSADNVVKENCSRFGEYWESCVFFPSHTSKLCRMQAIALKLHGIYSPTIAVEDDEFRLEVERYKTFFWPIQIPLAGTIVWQDFAIFFLRNSIYAGFFLILYSFTSYLVSYF